MTKRLISLLLALCLAVSAIPVGALAAEDKGSGSLNPFSDVPESSWYRDDVVYVYVNGLLLGVGEDRFDPSGAMSRAMFVTVLGRMAGIDPENYRGEPAFSDVKAGAYYAPYVSWAAKYGIAAGDGGGKFFPDAPVTRQEMICFFARYFDTFTVALSWDNPAGGEPGDMDKTSGWARDAVKKFWNSGLIEGDGKNFDPKRTAARAEAAAICHRADGRVQTWYSEPGAASDRVITDPFAPPGPDGGDEPGDDDNGDDKDNGGSSGGGYVSNYYSVAFFDGDKRIDTLYARKNQPLKRVPDVEKSSKDGAVLLGYYTDPELTKPFYAEEPVTHNTKVYAKYQELESNEELNFTTFTQMDMGTDISFAIYRAEGEVPVDKSAVLSIKDGSDPVKLEFSGDENSCTVSAAGGFNEGCSYELTLADGWVFDEKPETVRTAAFSIYKAEVENLRMGQDVKYLQDTDDIDYVVDGKTYGVLTSDLLTESGGSFNYDGGELSEGDILCVYVGVRPDKRDSKEGGELLDPAVYVKVSGVYGNTVSFELMDAEDQVKLYEVPDNFPLLVGEMPEDEANISSLDLSMYENMMGAQDGNLDYAKERINVGDFVTLYTSEDIGSEDDVRFGLITEYDETTGAITYEPATSQDIIDSMELYQHIDIDGDDLVSPEEQEEIVKDVQDQIDQSDFGEQAAYLLSDLVTSTDQFQNDEALQGFIMDSADAYSAGNFGLSLDGGSTKVKARLITSGSELHFNKGVQLALDVSAKFNAPINSLGNTLSIDLSATFAQEVYIRPTARGGLVFKKVLGFIPVPIGVEIGANVDVKSYTALSFDAEITTHDKSDILYSTSIVSELEDMLTQSDAGLSGEYQSSVDALMAKYSEMLFQETDWINLVEEDIIKNAEVGIYAIGIGLGGQFVVGTDMSIAIGSNLEYETGKRYSFWFKVGLFKPTAGSSSMDILDESFAFRFYVMGKLGLRCGVKLEIYVQLGCGAIAKAGLTAEVGPYVKLYGFFIYEMSKYRPSGSSLWDYKQQMAGALYLEFGLYVNLGYEASVLSVFEFSDNFLEMEFPLATAGDERYYYGFSYKPMEDESVVVRDDDANGENGVSMKLPDTVRELSYMTLNTGMRGSAALPLGRYHFTVSNPNFTYDDSTGTVSVTVPENTHFMECDLTVTYLHGKLAFSTYDMSVTIPLVWTDLSDRELNEYFTASVRVGNDVDGYETVWSKKVLRGQGFDQPTDENIKALINFNDDKYSSAAGYKEGQQLEELTIYTDTVYDYDVEYKSYELTVEGIQNDDGTTREEKFTAKYGQSFDFSRLTSTGTDIAGQTYTKFTKVTAGDINLYRPINGAMARWLSGGGLAQANYVDDDVTAVFTFSGIDHEDVTVKGRKGTMPQLSAVQEVIDEANFYGDSVGIQEISPELGNIDHSENYIVTCVKLTGERAELSFDMNGGDQSEAPEAMSKLVGSLIINLPIVEREGYVFDGWYTEDGVEAETRTIPQEDITLYAHWTPRQYTVSFNANGGQSAPENITVTFDSAYGDMGKAVPKSGERFVGWWTTADSSGSEVTAEDMVNTVGDRVLYAHYKPLVQINPDWINFGEKESFTYEKGVVRAAEYVFNKDNPAMTGGEDGENIPFPTDGYALVYVPTQGGLGISTEEPFNAGTFQVRVTRPADELYAAFEHVYTDVLTINKADRDVSAAKPDPDNSIIGFNYLSVGTTVDDLGEGATVEFSMKLDGKNGISTKDGRSFFYGLNSETHYTAELISVSIKNDPNYNDVRGKPNTTAAISTKSTPSGSWSDHAGSLTVNIKTPEDMAALMAAVKSGDQCTGQTFTLHNDIDMSAYKWDTSGTTFNGTFDGGGHKIYGIYTYAPNSGNVGLFGILGGQATVRNVLLAGGRITGGTLVGSIAGYGNDGAIVDNCVNYATIKAEGSGTDTDAGGFLGKVSESQNDGKGTKVRNCVNYGSVSGAGNHTGGIIGYQLGSSTISNCANYGSIYSSAECIGGIVGENFNKSSLVYNCVNGGSVTGGNGYRGAIVGRNNKNSGHVDQCYYLAGSAPNRTSAGTDDGAVKNDINSDDHRKCSAFDSYNAPPREVPEDGANKSMTLLEVLNHWVTRCNKDYPSSYWELSGPNGEPVPNSIPRP